MGLSAQNQFDPLAKERQKLYREAGIKSGEEQTAAAERDAPSDRTVRWTPLLFSPEMVRARRAGIKTQTRRIIQPSRSSSVLGGWSKKVVNWQEAGWIQPFWNALGRCEKWWTASHDRWRPGAIGHFLCPYGVRGDRLWVRETWSVPALYDAVRPRDLDPRLKASVRYHADGVQASGRVRQSIFLPRWASRDTPELVGVRVQRVQDISEADAIAEGWPKAAGDFAGPAPGNGGPLDWYRELWCSINGRETWERNVWVWVLDLSPFVPDLETTG